jgi:hypothetical protein
MGFAAPLIALGPVPIWTKLRGKRHLGRIFSRQTTRKREESRLHYYQSWDFLEDIWIQSNGLLQLNARQLSWHNPCNFTASGVWKDWYCGFQEIFAIVRSITSSRHESANSGKARKTRWISTSSESSPSLILSVSTLLSFSDCIASSLSSRCSPCPCWNRTLHQQQGTSPTPQFAEILATYIFSVAWLKISLRPNPSLPSFLPRYSSSDPVDLLAINWRTIFWI